MWRIAPFPHQNARSCADRMHIVAQVDALVRVVRDAERELLASGFWTGLRRCFAQAQEQLAQQLALPIAEAGFSGQQHAEEEAPAAVSSQGSVALHDTGQSAGPSAAEDCERRSSRDFSPGREHDVERAGSLPNSASPASRQPQELLPEGPASGTSPAEDGHDEGKVEDSRQSSAEQLKPAAGLSSGSTAPGAVPGVLGRWADVRQLVVYGLGSLESGDFPSTSERISCRYVWCMGSGSMPVTGRPVLASAGSGSDVPGSRVVSVDRCPHYSCIV